MRHTHRSRPAPTARRIARRAAVLAAAATLGACSGELTGIAGSTTTALTAGGSTSRAGVRLDPALIGRWHRAVVFASYDGSTNSSETTWSFAGDGSALRTVISRNLTFGLADAVSDPALWRVEGGTVVIDFGPLGSAPARFAYYVERRAGGELLSLGGQRYTRVGY
jgi:hypothetical protein